MENAEEETDFTTKGRRSTLKTSQRWDDIANNRSEHCWVDCKGRRGVIKTV